MNFEVNEVHGKKISVEEDGKPIFTFAFGKEVSHPYFHPLYAPNGEIVTDRNDKRHPPGICFSWGSVKVGKDNSVKQHQILLSSNQITYESSRSQSYAKFIHTTKWGSDAPIFTLIYNVTVHSLNNSVRVMDLSIDIQASTYPILFESDFRLSYNSVEMEHRKVANSNGDIGEAEVDGKESEWTTLCGIANNDTIGLSILPDMDNGPTIFQAEDIYQGYLSANIAPFSLQSNEKRELKYRILIFLGDLFTFDVTDYLEHTS